MSRNQETQQTNDAIKTNDATPAPKETLQQETQTTLEELAEEIIEGETGKINHAISIPFEDIEANESTGTTISLEDIKDAAESGEWEKVIGLVIKFFFGNTNGVQGLGFFANSLSNLEPEKTADLNEQLESIDQIGMQWNKKMKIAMLRSSTGYELYRQGYDRERTAITDHTVELRAGQTIQSAVSEKVWAEIQERNVVGPLDFTESLPINGHLYLDSQGYPLYFGTTPDETPAIPFYRKTDRPILAAEEDEIESETRLDYMEKQLQPGDILFINRPQEQLDSMRKALYSVGRALQGDPKFPFIHIAVYLGKGEIMHINQNGGERQKLNRLIPDEWNAMSVGRLNASMEDRQEFADAANEVGKKTSGYSVMGLATRGLELFSDTDIPVASESEKICVQLASDAAEETGHQELAQDRSAYEMFETLEIIESMEF